jgi:hypothetical protein
MMNFVMGHGGIIDFIGRLEYHTTKERNFSPADCIGNTVVLGKNRTLVCASANEVIVGVIGISICR